MLIIKSFNKNMQEDLRFSLSLLRSMKVEELNIKFFDDYPNISMGELISSKKIDDWYKNEVKISNFVDFSKYDISNVIIEIEFKMKVKEKLIDGFLRIYNRRLSKIYGDFEMDIYPFDNISNLGDLILLYNLRDLRGIIDNHIINESKNFGLRIREAYISISEGEPSIDLSKKIWAYYSTPVFFIADVMSFIKNFKEIEIDGGLKMPSYLMEAYEKIIPQIIPYNITFLGREFMGSEKFRSKFNNFVKENEIEVKTGSLVLSSNDIDRNLNLVREVSEKLIFPIMEKVTGESQFKKIIDETL